MIVAGLVLLAVGTYVMKAIGPFTAASRRLPTSVALLADDLLPAALLAALVATQAIGADVGIAIDARIIGVSAAAIAIVARAPFALVVVIGAGATALTRALGWG